MSNHPIIKAKKNCLNCSGLNYYEGNEYEGEGPSGYFCENRVYKCEDDEQKHLKKLQGDAYLKRPKKCFHDPNSVTMEY